MPHFPRFSAQQQSPMDLATLLSLLAEPHSSQAQKETAKQSYHPHRNQSFSPKFDVFETSKDYVLEGELPGLQDKKKIEIEFSDPQTLVIRGRIEKHVEEPVAAPTSKPVAIEEKPQVAEDKPAPHAEKPVSRPHTPPRPVTVEESPDEDDLDYEDARHSLTQLTPTSTNTTEVEKAASDASKPKPKQQQPQLRYWVTERTIGNFQRTFNFPGFIDQEGVTARLENGILTIVVPKRQKSAIRKVEIL
ncbi:heat shock protein 30 [Peziza echinospora]|nr:heat shock protein 30 [Peziza echinospora]